jgi:hypothetical protein
VSKKTKLDEALDVALSGIGPLALMVAARRLRPVVLDATEKALVEALELIRQFRQEIGR